MPNQSGGPPACAGRGRHQTSRNDKVGDSNAAGASRQSARQARSPSSKSCQRLPKSSPLASYSSFCQPVPTPTSSRPRDSTSSVASVLASSAGGRSGVISTPVPSRTRDETPASAASSVSGSGQGSSSGSGKGPYGYFSRCGPITTWSGITSWSTPVSSAMRARSISAARSSPYRRPTEEIVTESDTERAKAQLGGGNTLMFPISQ